MKKAAVSTNKNQDQQSNLITLYKPPFVTVTPNRNVPSTTNVKYLLRQNRITDLTEKVIFLAVELYALYALKGIWLEGVPLGGISVSYGATGAPANNTAFDLHSDHLNTPRIATNAARTKVWEWVSDAFGTKKASGQLEINLRFPGQYYDVETGLHYNYFRDYDPKTGRYMQSDPIGLNGGLNAFGYVEGNPITYVDFYGLEKLNLSNPKKDHIINNAYKKDKDKPGTLIIYGHGNEMKVHDDSQGIRSSLNAGQLAERILASGQYTPKMPIELRSCNTGTGQTPIAQELANVLEASVSAPTTFYYYNLDGSAGPKNIDWLGRPSTPGTMKHFEPRSQP